MRNTFSELLHTWSSLNRWSYSNFHKLSCCYTMCILKKSNNTVGYSVQFQLDPNCYNLFSYIITSHQKISLCESISGLSWMWHRTDFTSFTKQTFVNHLIFKQHCKHTHYCTNLHATRWSRMQTEVTQLGYVLYTHVMSCQNMIWSKQNLICQRNTNTYGS
jgi:hypothetical protein